MGSARKILVTGGTGFLGQHVVARLLERPDVCLRLVSTGPLPDPLRGANLEWIQGSIVDPELAAASVQGVDVVYHLAGRVSRSRDDARLMYELHVDGTRILLQAAQQAGVGRVILASTSGTIAVGRDAQARPDERAPAPLEIISRWPYYASKLYQEQVAQRLCQDAGIQLCTLHPSLLLGPGDDRISSTTDVLRFLRRDIPFVPSGGLNFVDVRDVADAFVAVLQRDEDGERYLLGGPNWTFKQFFGRLERMTKVPGPLLRAPDNVSVWGARLVDAVYRRLDKVAPVDGVSAEMATYFWYFDDSQAREQLGFSSRDPSETLYDTVRYLQQGAAVV